VGYTQRTNKLISVIPIKNRYNAQLGDIVIGRVVEIINKKWKVDINSYDLATLSINAVKLQEVQRRKTDEDEKQMRTLFKEGDLILAEV
jgi:exosome complex component RRP4